MMQKTAIRLIQELQLQISSSSTTTTTTTPRSSAIHHDDRHTSSISSSSPSSHLAAAAVTAWQVHVTTLSLAAWLIAQPTLRPPGWNSSTLVALSKLSVVGWGGIWIMGVYYMEYRLRESTQERRLLRQWLRFLLILGIAVGLLYLPTFL